MSRAQERAQKALQALREAGERGMSSTELQRVLWASESSVQQYLRLLESAGTAGRAGAGRRTRWIDTPRLAALREWTERDVLERIMIHEGRTLAGAMARRAQHNASRRAAAALGEKHD